MPIQAYLFFDGRCEEALEYYGRVLSAKIVGLMRFKDSPEAPQGGGCMPPGHENKVMHASFRIGDTELMASDGNCGGKAAFQGFALSCPVATDAEAERVFNLLADGGQVQMPMTKTFFSSRFGMVADRFGVSWMVIVQ
jgi:PhnB protein